MRLTSGVVVLALTGGACGTSEPLTELLVATDTDLAVPSELDGVRFEVDGTALGEATSMHEGRFGSGRPVTLALVHRGGPLGPVIVRVFALKGSAATGLVREAHVSFVRGEVRVLRMDLLAACRDTTCGAGQTCGDGGRCRSVVVTEPELLPYAGPPLPLDASRPIPEGGATDAGSSDGGCVRVDETCNGRDDDCDGASDEDFDLATDPARCGACARSCGAGIECDARVCADRPVSVAAGSRHSCATDEAGAVWCWGGNEEGQLGDELSSGRAEPAVVAGVVDVRELAAGAEHSCALGAGGTVTCWGSDAEGQLGNGASSGGGPVGVAGLDAVRVTAGDTFSCAVVRDGTAACWGANTLGQLGNGTTTGATSPVAVEALDGVRAIAAGSDHACAVLETGALHCWGNNSDGQLGVSGSMRLAPVAVIASGVTSVTAGRLFTCAGRATGDTVCFGRADDGRLGAGMVPGGPTPRLVVDPDDARQPFSDVIWMDGGDSHACALARDGRMACWGSDAQGQLGRGMPTTRSLTPVWVPAGVTFSRVSSSHHHTCARADDGGVWCWGANDARQLGPGAGLTMSVPHRVVF